MTRPMYRVLVDGCPMAHGPTDPLWGRQPQQMADIYQRINPDSTITIEYRTNGDWHEDQAERQRSTSRLG